MIAWVLVADAPSAVAETSSLEARLELDLAEAGSAGGTPQGEVAERDLLRT